jgi:arabinogalactan oligomer / maltooligosaccharide transport system substrate-binding protein
MLTRRTALLGLAAAGATATLAACGGSDSGTTDETAAPADGGTAAPAGAEDEAPVRDPDADLVIWTDDVKAGSLEAPAQAWAEEQGIALAIQSVPGDQLQNAFITANQAGNGPDILIAAHDWIGNLVQNSSISTVNLADPSAFAPVAVDAVTYQGTVYGVPYAVETLALYVNTALTDVVEPATIEELVTAAEAAGTENLLSLPVGQQGDAYHMQPLYTAGGGYLFGENADGTLNPADVGVGQEGAVQAATKIGELGAAGVLKTSIDGQNNIPLFTDGTAPYLVSGPWALAQLREAGTEFAIAPIPGFEGLEPARAFTGVNAFYVASGAANAAFAQTFLTEVAGSTEIAKAMYEKNPLPPAHTALAEELAATDEQMVRFTEFAGLGQPMPSIPEMAAIWGPLGLAYSSIVDGADPESTIVSAGEEISTTLGN